MYVVGLGRTEGARRKTEDFGVRGGDAVEGIGGICMQRIGRWGRLLTGRSLDNQRGTYSCLEVFECSRH